MHERIETPSASYTASRHCLAGTIWVAVRRLFLISEEAGSVVGRWKLGDLGRGDRIVGRMARRCHCSLPRRALLARAFGFRGQLFLRPSWASAMASFWSMETVHFWASSDIWLMSLAPASALALSPEENPPHSGGRRSLTVTRRC